MSWLQWAGFAALIVLAWLTVDVILIGIFHLILRIWPPR